MWFRRVDQGIRDLWDFRDTRCNRRKSWIQLVLDIGETEGKHSTLAEHISSHPSRIRGAAGAVD
jgi:hypothetical protein